MVSLLQVERKPLFPGATCQRYMLHANETMFWKIESDFPLQGNISRVWFCKLFLSFGETKKGDLRRLKCFHNGIILIVICFKM